MAKCIIKKISSIEINTKKIDPKSLSNIRTDLRQDWSLLLPNKNDVDTNFLLFHNKLSNVLDAYTQGKMHQSFPQKNKQRTLDDEGHHCCKQ